MIVSKPVGAENTPQSDACMCRASTGVKVANNYVYDCSVSVKTVRNLIKSIGWVDLTGWARPSLPMAAMKAVRLLAEKACGGSLFHGLMTQGKRE